MATIIKMSKYDLLDKFEAYASEATFTKGNKITTTVVAIQDIEKVIDDLIKKLGNGKDYINSSK